MEWGVGWGGGWGGGRGCLCAFVCKYFSLSQRSRSPECSAQTPVVLHADLGGVVGVCVQRPLLVRIIFQD